MESEMKPMSSTISRSVEYGLRAFGVWPGTSYPILRRFLCIISLVVFQVVQYQYLIAHHGEDLSLLMDGLSVTLAYSLLLIRMIIIAYNTR